MNTIKPMLLILLSFVLGQSVLAQEEHLLPPRHFYFVDFTCSTQEIPTHEDYFMLTGEKQPDKTLYVEALQVKSGNLLFMTNINSAQFSETEEKYVVEGTTVSGAEFHFEYKIKSEKSVNTVPIHEGYFKITKQRQVIATDKLNCLERQNKK
ncbi:MAG: hypothetical protein IPM57_07260 [Oligoflexia bacterium]|nr:hypothetical protein [Oligoflexia bacterium]